MSKFRVLLDSSYLFPTLGIEIVEGWSKNDFLLLIQRNDIVLYYVDISLFEIFIKSLKLIMKQEIPLSQSELQRGIDGILNSNKLIKIDWYKWTDKMDLLLDLKKNHGDAMDCIIFLNSVLHCDCLATFDLSLIENLRKDQALLVKLLELNPDFHIWFEGLKGPWIPLKKFLE